jgi:hypothetical protein
MPVGPHEAPADRPEADCSPGRLRQRAAGSRVARCQFAKLAAAMTGPGTVLLVLGRHGESDPASRFKLAIKS